jgi:FkbM family methyltransferase
MNILRTIVERLSREKVIKRRIVVDGKSVPLLVSPDAQLKYLKMGSGVFDQDLINIAEKYLTEKSNVWDVGANVGVFTFVASSVAHKGTVVSIEADIWLANILRKTAMFKEYANNTVCVLPVAISNENSIASFMVAARGRASNALEAAGGRSQMGGVREKQYVPTLTIDTLLNTFPPPDFVKIDIEGAEYMALQGAKNIIPKICNFLLKEKK